VNILFLSTENPFPVDHGHHIRTYHVLRALADEHTIHFVGFSQNQSGFDYKYKLDELCETVAIFPLYFRGWKQLMPVLRNVISTAPLITQKYCQLEAVDYIHDLTSNKEIDLVHFDMLHLAGYRHEVDKLPCVLVNHNVESLRMRRWAKVETNPALKLFLLYQSTKLRHFERRVCPEFDICTAVSEEDRRMLVELCDGGQFDVVPNGVDTDYFYPASTETLPNSMVWAGSMKSPYNRDAVDYFIKAIWPLIQERITDAKVTFVGGSPTAQLQKAAQKSHTVSFTDYVDDVRPYIANAAVFVAPIRAGSGTKIKVLNAMAQGKPVVTTTVGAEGIEAKPDEEI